MDRMQSRAAAQKEERAEVEINLRRFEESWATEPATRRVILATLKSGGSIEDAAKAANVERALLYLTGLRRKKSPEESAQEALRRFVAELEQDSTLVVLKPRSKESAASRAASPDEEESAVTVQGDFNPQRIFSGMSGGSWAVDQAKRRQALRILHSEEGATLSTQKLADAIGITRLALTFSLKRWFGIKLDEGGRELLIKLLEHIEENPTPRKGKKKRPEKSESARSDDTPQASISVEKQKPPEKKVLTVPERVERIISTLLGDRKIVEEVDIQMGGYQTSEYFNVPLEHASTIPKLTTVKIHVKIPARRDTDEIARNNAGKPLRPIQEELARALVKEIHALEKGQPSAFDPVLKTTQRIELIVTENIGQHEKDTLTERGKITINADRKRQRMRAFEFPKKKDWRLEHS